MVPPIGFAIRAENRYILDDPAINAAEITFERADDPLRVERYLGDLEFDYVSVHSLKMSLASPEPAATHYLAGIKAIAQENDACMVSDHLGFTRNVDSGVEIGHFSPPPYTEAALDTVCRNVDRIQKYFGDIKFCVENVAYLFRLEATMGEAEFLQRLFERTGCGWLLDVANLYANARNHGYDDYRFIDELMPYANDIQIHLAGGVDSKEHKMYFDSHSENVPDGIKELYQHALRLGRNKIKGVIIERDQNFPDEIGWRNEIRSIRQITEEIYEEIELPLENEELRISL